MTMRLQDGTRSVALPNPLPERRRVDAGAFDDNGVPGMTVTLELAHLDEAEFQALLAFHNDTAPRGLPFTWHDGADKTLLVRFDGPLESARHGPEDWDVVLRLARYALTAEEGGGGEGPPVLGRVTFRSGAFQFEWPAPSLRRRIALERRQAEGFTAAGTRHVHDGGVTRRVETLAFAGVTDQERRDMDAFFLAVGGARDDFDFVEADGTPRRLHFGGKTVAWTASGPDAWAAEIALAEEIADIADTGSDDDTGSGDDPEE